MKINFKLGKAFSKDVLTRLINQGVCKNVSINSNDLHLTDILTFENESINLILHLPNFKNDGCLFFIETGSNDNAIDLVEIYYKSSKTIGEDFIVTEILNFAEHAAFNYGEIKIKIKE